MTTPVQDRVDSVSDAEAVGSLAVLDPLSATEHLRARLSGNNILSVTAGHLGSISSMHIEIHVHTSFSYPNFCSLQVWNFFRSKNTLP